MGHSLKYDLLGLQPVLWEKVRVKVNFLGFGDWSGVMQSLPYGLRAVQWDSVDPRRRSPFLRESS